MYLVSQSKKFKVSMKLKCRKRSVYHLDLQIAKVPKKATAVTGGTYRYRYAAHLNSEHTRYAQTDLTRRQILTYIIFCSSP
jgi:hypothetical protein